MFRSLFYDHLPGAFICLFGMWPYAVYLYVCPMYLSVGCLVVNVCGRMPSICMCVRCTCLWVVWSWTVHPEDMCIHKLVRGLGYEMDDLGYDSRQEHEICLFYETSDRCWNPFSHLLNGLLVFSYRQQCGRGWMLPTRLHLFPSLWMSEIVFLLLLWPIRWQVLSLPLMSYAARVDSNSFTMTYLVLPSVLAHGSWFTWYSSATLLTVTFVGHS
jgi:hypothetical protein